MLMGHADRHLYHTFQGTVPQRHFRRSITFRGSVMPSGHHPLGNAQYHNRDCGRIVFKSESGMWGLKGRCISAHSGGQYRASVAVPKNHTYTAVSGSCRNRRMLFAFIPAILKLTLKNEFNLHPMLNYAASVYRVPDLQIYGV